MISIKTCGRVAVYVLSIFFQGGAYAALAENLTVSPEALSMGNAVTADPPGIFSIHYNPAGLVQFPEGTYNHLSFLLPPSITSEAKFTAPSDYQGVFGFTDDPVIGATTKVTSIQAYVPTKGPYKISDKFIPAPLGGIAHRPEGSKFVYANAAYAYVAAGMGRDEEDFAGSFAATNTIIQRIVFLSPSIAMNVTDTLSFGMSAGFNYSAFYLEQSLRANNEILGLARFVAEEICPTLTNTGGIPFIPPKCLGDVPLSPFSKLADIKLEATDPFGLSFNMGFLWEPNQTFSLGMVYQSPLRANLRGEFAINYDESLIKTIDALNDDAFIAIILEIFGLPTTVPNNEIGDLRIDLEFPDHVSLGTKFMLTERLQLNVDWHWTDWEQWNTLQVVLSQGTVLTQLGRYVGISTTDQLNLNLGLENQANFSFGMKYQLSSRIELRTGAENRKSSVPDNKRSVQLPFGDTWLFGAGIGYKFTENMSFDFSIAHFFSKEFIPAGTSDNANATGIDNVLSPYAGLDVEFETKGTLGAVSFKTRF